jgi:hypothetical protein
MNGNDTPPSPDDPPQPPVSEKVQLLAVIFCGMIASGGMFGFVFCMCWKIYIDAPMLIAVSTTIGNITGSLCMVFAIRKIAQLNQNSQVKNSPQTQTAPITQT